MSEVATRESWSDLKPMPEARKALAVNMLFTREDFERVKAGFIPQDMADKWFIYYEDGSLFFHRSWSGICIYVANFMPSQDGRLLETVVVNRDREEYRNEDDQYDHDLALILIANLLLGMELPLPDHPSVDEPIARELQNWSVAGRGKRANQGDQGVQGE